MDTVQAIRLVGTAIGAEMGTHMELMQISRQSPSIEDLHVRDGLQLRTFYHVRLRLRARCP